MNTLSLSRRLAVYRKLGNKIMQRFLQASEFIDFDHPAIAATRMELAAECADRRTVAQRCFEFVRDRIRHSWDYRLNPVTCKASDVLRHGTGFCFAKSHLLAALLRANGIPAGLCYQRVSLGDAGPPFYLHGLNAVHLPEQGWYRIDARGDKPGVHAQFTPPVECLAYPSLTPPEADMPEIWPEPLPAVVDVLTRYKTFEDVVNHLPDIEMIEVLCSCASKRG